MKYLFLLLGYTFFFLYGLCKNKTKGKEGGRQSGKKRTVVSSK